MPSSTVPQTPSVGAVSISEERILAKATLRLLPLLIVLYTFNYLDRVNVSVAALTMKQDLGLSDTVYGFGAGIFFIGYFLFEVPSNAILERVGARRWIARILISWGIISSAMMFARGPVSFCALRLLLGVAEAGFFPGIMLYLTYWFPAGVRARTTARFVVAGSFAGILGGPLGSVFLAWNGLGGLKGWQWLFLMEGIPSFLLGFVVLRLLPDRPETAAWLAPEERTWLTERIQADQSLRRKQSPLRLRDTLSHPRVLHLCLLFFLMQVCGYGLGFWTPQLLKARSTWNDTQVLWYGAIPAVVGVAALFAGAAHSDRTRGRRGYVVGGLLIEVAGIALCAVTRSPITTLFAMCVISIGGSLANGPFWALTTGLFAGPAAAGSIAFVNSVGNSGGLVGPSMMGALLQHTHDYRAGVIVLAVAMLAATAAAWLFPHDATVERGEAATAAEPDPARADP